MFVARHFVLCCVCAIRWGLQSQRGKDGECNPHGGELLSGSISCPASGPRVPGCLRELLLGPLDAKGSHLLPPPVRAGDGMRGGIAGARWNRSSSLQESPCGTDSGTRARQWGCPSSGVLFLDAALVLFPCLQRGVASFHFAVFSLLVSWLLRSPSQRQTRARTCSSNGRRK